MEIFDLGIAWNWEPDTAFVRELNDRLLTEGRKPYLIHAYNFYTSLKDICEENIRIRLFLDRTINDNTPLSEVGDFLGRKNITFINYPDKAKKLLKRSTAYHEPIRHNILLPMKIMLRPRDSVETLRLKISYMARPFVLEPIEGSPDIEVNTDAMSIEDVLRMKERYGAITYVAQERIYPAILDEKHASFKCVYCLGEIVHSWWYSAHNIYEVLTPHDMDRLELNQLLTITYEIAHISKMDFFSTDIVMDKKTNFFVTNYINPRPDMRRRSKFDNGVPDEMVEKIIKKIIYFTKQKTKNSCNIGVA